PQLSRIFSTEHSTPHYPHPFPTRRSSDLFTSHGETPVRRLPSGRHTIGTFPRQTRHNFRARLKNGGKGAAGPGGDKSRAGGGADPGPLWRRWSDVEAGRLRDRAERVDDRHLHLVVTARRWSAVAENGGPAERVRAGSELAGEDGHDGRAVRREDGHSRLGAPGEREPRSEERR